MYLTNIIQEPESDTEIAQNGITLVDKVMTRYPEVLFGLQPSQLLEFFFMFTLKVLNGKEPLPKSAAADFWVCHLPCSASLPYSLTKTPGTDGVHFPQA